MISALRHEQTNANVRTNEPTESKQKLKKVQSSINSDVSRKFITEKWEFR